MEVFIQDLKSYNDGIILGGWYRLGDSEENLQEFIERKIADDGVKNPAIFISDYRQDDILYKTNEFDDVFMLNELVRQFYGLDIAEQEKVNAILDSGFYYDLELAIDHKDSYTLYRDIQSEEDLGRYLIEELETCQVPKFIKPYIDYEAYGRDEQINSNGAFTMYGYLEEA